MCLITHIPPLPKSHLYCPSPSPLWNSFSELSEVLSPWLQSSHCPPKNLTHSSHVVHFFSRRDDPKTILPQRGINWIINSLLYLTWIIKKSKEYPSWIPLWWKTSRLIPVHMKSNIQCSQLAGDTNSVWILLKMMARSFHSKQRSLDTFCGPFTSCSAGRVIPTANFITSLLVWHLAGKESQSYWLIYPSHFWRLLHWF